MKIFRIACVLVGLAAAWVSLPAAAPDPIAFRDAALGNPHLKDTDGELFAWNATGAANDLVQGYEATGDMRWLEGAESYFNFLLSKLTRDPDGREGWIGQSIWGTPGRKQLGAYRIDAVVGDAILLAPMLRFAEIVKRDRALEARFGKSADLYIEKAKQIGWEKWNLRNTYYRDAAGFGSYRMPLHFIDAKSGAWVETPVVPHSENLNKHSAMALVMVRLWRVTGNVEYRLRAEEIMARLKHLFRYFPEDDRVTWNFWMPHGSHDIVDGKLASWVGVHPNRPAYQSEEVARMVELYDSGLVFDQADLQRLVNANHFMMPAQSGGKWRSSDGSSEAGKLWGSLVRFDETLRARWLETLKNPRTPKEQLELAYYENVTAKNLGWRRLFVLNELEVRIFAQAPQPGAALAASVIVPDSIDVGRDPNVTTRLVTQTRVAGELVIELLSADGRQVLGELHRAQVGDGAAIILPSWDGTNPMTKEKSPGQYLVRWKLNKDTRTERVWVKSTRPDQPPVAASSFQGNYVPENVLDGDLATRWSAEGNEQWLSLDLGASRKLDAVGIAFAQGDKRNALFVLQVSLDGRTWTNVFDGQSSGKTTGVETFAFPEIEACHVRYLGYGNSDNAWNSLSEITLTPRAAAVAK
ncbi:discoidin domain-containing protein [Oleiharenicola lentus]|uniref:discoidin domain-containing protein n=1 Tax=Oleiharenicola lentus TaxID=2508720 RepID=UPI003F678D12